ncbi:MAG: sulfur reduction protein DsrJ [Thiohalocapsa sp.]|jgi:hypothetical protein|uniref:sulfur reduction protein DsrJ n=1 Tax=Thiohalocapsa sp. TaxID=2497641 RepID=UPI0025D0CD3D|nr:sulfur reduction protein DsrJ [Thiohalocapsa sp.]MCG6941756.1 sulfur reduction protein DsrJ [Thiohalocapsa sp.]
MTHFHPKLRAPVAIAPLVLLGLLCLGLAAAAQATGVGDFVVDSSRAAKLDHCVEPTEYMRRYHYELIRHQRDTTVYGGIRSTKHSLAGCVKCHVGYDAQHKPVAVNAKHQFCNACHSYAAVTVNCFDCHATVPKGESWNQVTAGDREALLPGVHPQVGAAAPAAPGAAPESRDQ